MLKPPRFIAYFSKLLICPIILTGLKEAPLSPASLANLSQRENSLVFTSWTAETTSPTVFGVLDVSPPYSSGSLISFIIF